MLKNLHYMIAISYIWKYSADVWRDHRCGTAMGQSALLWRLVLLFVRDTAIIGGHLLYVC